MPFRPPVHRPKGWVLASRNPTPSDPFYASAAWHRLREAVKRRDHYRCTMPDCQTPKRGIGGRLIVDHIVERRDGGSDDPSNLRTICPACDNRRHRRGARLCQ